MRKPMQLLPKVLQVAQLHKGSWKTLTQKQHWLWIWEHQSIQSYKQWDIQIPILFSSTSKFMSASKALDH